MLNSDLNRLLSTTERGMRSSVTKLTTASATKICLGFCGLIFFEAVVNVSMIAVIHLHFILLSKELGVVVSIKLKWVSTVTEQYSYHMLPPICSSPNRSSNFLGTVLALSLKVLSWQGFWYFIVIEHSWNFLLS